MNPRFVINREGWVTEQPYDIFTLVAEQLEPDMAAVPFTSALRDVAVVDHLAKISAMVAKIAELLPYESQVELARQLGYKEAA